jgi:hypothetical protein
MKETRKVSWDCLISFRGIRYSVPHIYAGKRVWVRVSQGSTLEIYSEKGGFLAKHQLSFTKGSTISKGEHYEGLKGSVPKSLPVLRETFINKFPSGKAFVELLEKKTTNNHGSYLQKILELEHSYELECIETSIRQAIEFKRIDNAFFKHVLRDTPRKKDDYTIKGALPNIQSNSRSLKYYKNLLQ